MPGAHERRRQARRCRRSSRCRRAGSRGRSGSRTARDPNADAAGPLLGSARDGASTYRLRTPSTGREILVEAEPGHTSTSTARRASRSRSSARCCRSRRRSRSCRGRSRTCGSATGATSWPRRTSTTARRAAAAWPRSRADARLRHRAPAPLHASLHRTRARPRRRRLRRQRQRRPRGPRPAGRAERAAPSRAPPTPSRRTPAPRRRRRASADAHRHDADPRHRDDGHHRHDRRHRHRRHRPARRDARRRQQQDSATNDTAPAGGSHAAAVRAVLPAEPRRLLTRPCRLKLDARIEGADARRDSLRSSAGCTPYSIATARRAPRCPHAAAARRAARTRDARRRARRARCATASPSARSTCSRSRRAATPATPRAAVEGPAPATCMVLDERPSGVALRGRHRRAAGRPGRAAAPRASARTSSSASTSPRWPVRPDRLGRRGPHVAILISHEPRDFDADAIELAADARRPGRRRGLARLESERRRAAARPSRTPRSCAPRRALNASLDLQEVLRTLAREAARRRRRDWPASTSATARTAASRPRATTCPTSWHGAASLSPARASPGRVLLTGEPFVTNDYQRDDGRSRHELARRVQDRARRPDGVERGAQGRAVGRLDRRCAGSTTRTCARSRRSPTLATVACRNAEAYEQRPAVAARTDALTGLLNHGAMQLRVREEIARARRDRRAAAPA